MGKFQIFKGNDGDFYFRLRAGNGEIILNSEGYEQKSGVENGIASVKENAPLDDRYRRKVASNGQHYFTLVAANYQVIGKSEMYSSAAAMENGIESVKENAPKAPIEDLS